MKSISTIAACLASQSKEAPKEQLRGGSSRTSSCTFTPIPASMVEWTAGITNATQNSRLHKIWGIMGASTNLAAIWRGRTEARRIRKGFLGRRSPSSPHCPHQVDMNRVASPRIKIALRLGTLVTQNRTWGFGESQLSFRLWPQRGLSCVMPHLGPLHVLRPRCPVVNLSPTT